MFQYFHLQISLSLENVLDMENISLRRIFAELDGFETKVFAKNWKKGVKVRILIILKI